MYYFALDKNHCTCLKIKKDWKETQRIIFLNIAACFSSVNIGKNKQKSHPSKRILSFGKKIVNSSASCREGFNMILFIVDSINVGKIK